MRARSRRKAWLHALGHGSPPPSFELEGRRFALERVYKHDFFAATARYAADDGRRVVLKLARRAALCGLPMGWLGRLVTWNEARALEALEGLACVPRLVARPEPGTLVRGFLAGHTLHRGEALDEAFFPALGRALDGLHARGWAYVDLEKPENVIVGDDGRPYLCDFQIAWAWPRRLGRLGAWGPLGWWIGVLQRADRYHLAKLERRLRPQGMTPEALAGARRRPWSVRVHRALTRPFQRVRRQLLDRLEPRRLRGERGRVAGEERALPEPLTRLGGLPEVRS